MNYFELFELPVAPAVDRSSLAAKYFELQKRNHPDFFTQATDSEKEVSLTLSADINKAFTIFRDEQKTIEYFLQTVGSITKDEKFNLPSDFLMEMMEINEALTEEDAANAAKRVNEYEARLFSDVRPLIEQYNDKSRNKEELESLKAYYYKKKYLNRILDRLAD